MALMAAKTHTRDSIPCCEYSVRGKERQKPHIKGMIYMVRMWTNELRRTTDYHSSNGNSTPRTKDAVASDSALDRCFWPKLSVAFQANPPGPGTGPGHILIALMACLLACLLACFEQKLVETFEPKRCNQLSNDILMGVSFFGGPHSNGAFPFGFPLIITKKKGYPQQKQTHAYSTLATFSNGHSCCPLGLQAPKARHRLGFS